MSGAARFRGAVLAAGFLLALPFSSSAIAGEPLRLTVVAATAEPNMQTGGPTLRIRLADSSRQLLAIFTTKNMGQRVNVAVDGQSVSKPVIREPITGGTMLISIKSFEEAQSLAAHLTEQTATLTVEPARN